MHPWWSGFHSECFLLYVVYIRIACLKNPSGRAQPSICFLSHTKAQTHKGLVFVLMVWDGIVWDFYFLIYPSLAKRAKKADNYYYYRRQAGRCALKNAGFVKKYFTLIVLCVGNRSDFVHSRMYIK
jgi:hypothetical protein